MTELDEAIAGQVNEVGFEEGHVHSNRSLANAAMMPVLL